MTSLRKKERIRLKGEQERRKQNDKQKEEKDNISEKRDAEIKSESKNVYLGIGPEDECTFVPLVSEEDDRTGN